MGVFAPAAAPLAARVGAIRAVTVALALIAGGGVGARAPARRLRRDRADGAGRRRHGPRQRAHGRRRQGALRRSPAARHRRLRQRHPGRRGDHDRALRCRSPTPATPGARRCSCSRWPPPASLAWWLAATHGGGPRPVGKRAHFPLRKPIAWLFVALFATTAFVYYGYAAWLPDAFTRARLVGRATPASSCVAINVFAIISSVIGDARRRPLPLVAARAPDPAVRLLRRRRDRHRRSIRRTRSSGPACSASATAPSSR